MTQERSTVSPQLIAAMIETTPDRVRRRLDREPDTAAAWSWELRDESWSVNTGGEVVKFPRGHLIAMEQLTCTCLLGPRCFHVLACLTRLEIVTAEAEPNRESAEPASSAVAEDQVELTNQQTRAARELMNQLNQLLRAGIANAGVVIQAGLLRAIHQCRAEGLHRLAALGLRIVAGTQEFRTRAIASDPAQLAEDLTDALQTSRHLLGETPVASFWVGTARRQQRPVRPRKLHGLLAEPILTRTGYSGAAVYFLGEDDRIYSASDVRPGDSQRVRDAYLGGIEMGPLIQPARQLARGLYLGTELTASDDGRLGRGREVKLVEQGTSSWKADAIQRRFQQPLQDQWDLAYRHADLPAEVRRAGWDFVFLEGVVLGAAGPELLLQHAGDGQFIRLAIETESEFLGFRENLRLLSHAPGLRLAIIARLNLRDPRIVFPLAVAPSEEAEAVEGVPRLEVPAPLAGRFCLGFDEIHRHFLLNARDSAVALRIELAEPDEHPLGSLQRRWIALMLSGLTAQRVANAKLLAFETAALDRSGFATGAALLEALTSSSTAIADGFLAIAVYMRSCSAEWARAKGRLKNEG